MKNRIAVLVLSATFVALMGCGSSSSTTTTTTEEVVSVSSLTQLPDMTEIVNGGTTLASLSAVTLKDAVTGTPPLLAEITDESADTLFWNGLLATIVANNTASDGDIDNFWQGEGRCRMAQNVGYSFQGIEQAGTSLCYMRGMPAVSSGVGLSTGSVADLPGGVITGIFSQGATDRVVTVETTGEAPGDEEESNRNQNIFIKVYGTGSTQGADGYAFDIWFCDDGATTPAGYESYRVNTSTGVMTQASYQVNDEWGTYSSNFTGTLAEDTDGSLIFDTTADQTVDLFSESEQWGSHIANVTVNGSTLVAKESSSMIDPNTGDPAGSNKSYITSTFVGTSGETLRFASAGFKGLWTNPDDSENEYNGGTEFSTSTYTDLSSGTEYDTAAAVDLSAGFWTSSVAANSDAVTTLAGFSCSATPDFVVSMDFGDAAVQAVAADCEPAFREMQFCDSSSVQSARNIIFTAMSQQQQP